MADPFVSPIIKAAPVNTDAPRPQPKPIDPGMIDRIVNGWRAVVTSVDTGTWFGPMQPIAPIAPETKGRMFDYPVGFNTRITPRGEEPVSYPQLRELADAYYLIRLAIETRKDQMVKMRWSVQATDPKATGAIIATARKVEQFLRFPDREHDFATWLRMLIEDRLVIDAACIEPRRTLNGEPYSLDIVDGATIKRVIDAQGRTPAPPDPAYQQIIKGVPANNLTTDELMYAPANPRSNRLYGFSPVEQIVFIINIALRRETYKLQFYTEGSIPDALAQVPNEWTSSQIKEFQEWWDAVIEGNTATRRKIRFMPALKDITFPKDAVLKDQYDDWIARIVCYAFSLSPNALIAQVNRSTGETVQQAALDEGLAPLMSWVKNILDLCIQKYFGHPDLEFAWRDDASESILIQAQADDINLKNGSTSIDEVRARRGEDAVGIGPMIQTAGGVLPIDAIKAGQFTPSGSGPVDPFADPEKDSAPIPPELMAMAKARKKKVLKAPRNPVAADLSRNLSDRIESFFSGESVRIANDIANRIPDSAFAASKADNDDLFGAIESAAIVDAVDFAGWSILIEPIEGTLTSVATGQTRRALAQVGMADDRNAVIRANDAVVQYARDRAAELVGMRRTADGGLITNPNARWAITDTTRERLRDLVTRAVSGEGRTRQELISDIMGSTSFSAERAEMIAHTEVAIANLNAAVEGWKSSGVVTEKVWLLSNDHAHQDECDDNLAAGAVPIDEPFPSGVLNPPAHVNCLCDVAAIAAAES